MISFEVSGDTYKTDNFLKKALKTIDMKYVFDKYGKMGVEALRKATPKDSGLTSESWYYEIKNNKSSTIIEWSNRNVVDGWCNIAVILQYGHGTGTGGYVRGIDYINPAMKTIFSKIAEDLWREVTS